MEKQRRDRINSLIDELRELVPPHGCRDSGGGGSGGHAQGHGGHNTSTGSGGGHGDAVHDGHKRPKHVVLSDTIAMVKELQERVRSCSMMRGKPDLTSPSLAELDSLVELSWCGGGGSEGRGTVEGELCAGLEGRERMLRHN